MIQTPKQQQKSNKIFNIIRNFEMMFYDEFQQCDIKRCGHCNGTGYKDKHQLDFCDICGGIGYRGFKKIEGEFVCRTCNGAGCIKCNNRGIVDWIAHANGRDTYKGEKHL